jgi:general secretion pathway protein G
VTILALLSAWQGLGAHENFQYQQPRTRRLLRRIDSAIRSYMEKTGKPPSTLGELEALKGGSYPVDPDGAVRDGWNQPFRYSVDGGKYLVVSYGRDGKPGGRGLDCDLTSADPDPPRALPTFSQFLFDLPTGGVVWTSVFSGVVVFLLAFFTIKKDLYAGMPHTIVIKLVVMAIAAVLFASFISVLHIPTGH